ncbi:MAG TPA: YebC/PmpR family DNA-binding transcriptional regulator, partial [Candidatus Vogelbacteria bacterium]|nr:YebC/PmpR family DNA-binding transcriptional regulator [Candidatus Vogelbacteria bacterium]
MSGHNKWSKIKNKKSVEDAKKSKVFSILSKNISLEVKKSAGDKNSPNVRAAIEKARASNMPMVNIEKALNKQDKKGENLEEVLYEGYGPNGVGII